MRKSDTQLVNFDMDRATARKLLTVANQRGQSRAAVLRELIDNYLEQDGDTDD